MLPYFRRYLWAAYAVALFAPLALNLALQALGAAEFASSLPGAFISVAVLVAVLLVMVRAMSAKANRRANELFARYDERCDPQGFVRGAEPIVRTARVPYDPNAARFVSLYAMALADSGRFDEAARLGSNLQQSATLAESPIERALLLIQLEAVALRLYGPATALPVAQNLLALWDAIPAERALPYRDFLQGEVARLAARVAGDDEFLLSDYQARRADDTVPTRVRVLCANLEAEICRRRGDAARERECLEYVTAHGGGLPAVPFARARLAELQGA